MRIMHEYAIEDSFQGFSYTAGTEFSYALGVAHAETFAQTLNSSSEVKIVEQNTVVTASMPVELQKDDAICKMQEEAVWGLTRTSEKALKVDGYFHYRDASDGQGVYVYVVDTGIYMQNNDFDGRVVWGYDAVDSPSPQNDGNGHGTHCAGTVMASTYGLAKGATAVAVRVLGNSGAGSNAGVIAGVNFVANDGKGKKSVGSMSLGGGFSSVSNAAVTAAVSAGITMVVAAGNDGRDSCNYSPASAGGAAGTAITVMASDNTDRFASFSNWGKCSDIIAPGVSITSTWINSPSSINSISGTSMACPHVAGVAAMLLSKNGKMTPAAVKKEILSMASNNLISGISNVAGTSGAAQTPNVLLHKGCDEA